MSTSMLKLNPEKTEFIIFGSHVPLKELDSYLPVRIFGKLLHPSAVVKNLGVGFDANFSFAIHVSNICKTCFIQMNDIRWVRQYLTDEAAVLVANALVMSRLHYCNSLFRCLSSFYMHKLQCIQNTLDWIVTNCNRYSRAILILKKLCWLPIEFGCIFKTATLVYKFLHSGHPSYFSPYLSINCGLMAQDTTAQIKGTWRFLNTIHQYTNKKKHFSHSFAFDAPTFWNDLTDDVCSATNLACFRKKLKSYLFDKAFPP